MPLPSPQPPPVPLSAAPRRPVWRWVVLAAGLVVGTAAALTWWAGPDAIARAVTGMDPTLLAVAVGLEVGALACLTRVQVAAFRAVGGTLSTRDARVVALGSFGLSQLLPAGGAAAGVFAVHRLGRRADTVTATTSVVLAGTGSILMLGTIVTLGTGVAAAIGSGNGVVAVATGVATLLFAVVLLGLIRVVGSPVQRLRMVTWVARRTHRDVATRDAWLATLERQAHLLRHPARLLPTLGWAGLAWGLDIAVLAAVAGAVGLDVSLAGIITAYGVANLANAIPLTPGGAGLVEAGLAGSFMAMGVDAGAAAAVAVGYRLVGDMFPVVVALPVVLRAVHADVDPVRAVVEADVPGVSAVPVDAGVGAVGAAASSAAPRRGHAGAELAGTARRRHPVGIG